MIKSLITGITGQDGSYLAELLLDKGHEVHGIVRRCSVPNTSRIDHILDYLIVHNGDMADASQLDALIAEIRPDEIYNLASQSDVRVSFQQPTFTTEVNALGVLRIMEAVKNHCPDAKVYQASTSEMFGGVNVPPGGYTEKSPFHPRNPYAVAKLYSYWTVRTYRTAYNVFGCNGIMFNHESPRRATGFVTKKITQWCGEYMRSCDQRPLELGNLNAYRDWGHAKDFVNAMYLILQAPRPDDWLVATGESHTVREFVEKCFAWMDTKITWYGEGVNEVGKADDKTVITINPSLFRPAEVNVLLGNSSKIQNRLGWRPTYDFDSLVDEMMESEVNDPIKV